MAQRVGMDPNRLQEAASPAKAKQGPGEEFIDQSSAAGAKVAVPVIVSVAEQHTPKIAHPIIKPAAEYSTEQSSKAAKLGAKEIASSSAAKKTKDT